MSAYGSARRPAWGRGVSSGRLSRLGLASLLFLMLPAAANAYTLVLRNGRHVTVPDDFKVTPAAVIYEASPGFSVTVWLSNVDFAATERANAEPAGSFAGRVALAPGAARAGQRPGPKVVTNKDLEPSRLRREAQEEEYERTRRERGMPSKEELLERIEEQDRELREWARRAREERVEAELESLKYELVNARRELNELSLRLSRQAAYAPADCYPYFYAPPVQVITVFPFGHRGGLGRGGFGHHSHVRQWPHLRHPSPGHSSPAAMNRPRNVGSAPRVPAMPAPRRW